MLELVQIVSDHIHIALLNDTPLLPPGSLTELHSLDCERQNLSYRGIWFGAVVGVAGSGQDLLAHAVLTVLPGRHTLSLLGLGSTATFYGASGPFVYHDPVAVVGRTVSFRN